jgi:aryl-alcohol dehydrogenase-like predicted oxidoreductase
VEYGVGVLPYSPLADGMLTGKYRRGQALPDSVLAEENSARLEQNRDTIELLVSVAERNGMTPSQAAIAWTRSRPFVSAPIVGANRPEQLTAVLDGLSKQLPVEDLNALNMISSWPQSRAEIDS